MLPTVEEQDNKLGELLNKYILSDLKSIIKFTKEYAKWWAEKVIDVCAEEATSRLIGNPSDLTKTWLTVVDKESILKIKEQL